MGELRTMHVGRDAAERDVFADGKYMRARVAEICISLGPSSYRQTFALRELFANFTARKVATRCIYISRLIK